MKPGRGLALAALALGVAWLHGWGMVRLAQAKAPAVAETAPRPVVVALLVPASPEPAPLTTAPTAPSEAPRPARRVAALPTRQAAPLAPTIAPQAQLDDSVAGAADATVLVQTAYTAPAVAAPPAAALPEPLWIAAATPGADPATEPSAPVPTYRTRIPPAALLSYRLSRSGVTGSGELDWRPEAGGYSLRLEGSVPIVGTLITQTSQGRFDAAGLAPERYTDKRMRRGELAASFQRTAGVISFSGQQPDVPLTPGVQDRVSVMVQLAAIAAGWNKLPPVGEHFQVRVVGARGDSNVWSLRFEGPQTVVTPDGAVPALRFLREPEDPRGTRAEYWLDPARGHLPVRVRIADGSGDALELLRVK